MPSSPKATTNRWVGLAGVTKAGVIAGAALLLMGASCQSTSTSSSSAAPSSTDAASSAAASAAAVTLVPVDNADDPFTPPVAQDAKDVPPVETKQPTEVSGDKVGLYGGSEEINSCNKKQLSDFLAAPENRQMGEAWAKTLGISYDETGSYIDKATSALLRSDTLVTNHGWENGQATGFPSVLQAGTAVLLDDYGVPTVRCYCGNPLTPPPPYTPPPTPSYTPSYSPSYSPSYTPSYSPSFSPSFSPSYSPSPGGTAWKWWNPQSVTVIKASQATISEYTYVNIYDPSVTYPVKAGSASTWVPSPDSQPSSTYAPSPSYASPEPSYTYAPEPSYTSPEPSYTYAPEPSYTYPEPSYQQQQPSP